MLVRTYSNLPGSEIFLLQLANFAIGASFDKPIIDGTMTTREGWNASWNTNVTGAHIVTETFVPLLIKSSDARLIFLTSGTASLAESMDPEARINVSPAAGWRTYNSLPSSNLPINNSKSWKYRREKDLNFGFEPLLQSTRFLHPSL